MCVCAYVRMCVCASIPNFVLLLREAKALKVKHIRGSRERRIMVEVKKGRQAVRLSTLMVDTKMGANKSGERYGRRHT